MDYSDESFTTGNLIGPHHGPLSSPLAGQLHGPMVLGQVPRGVECGWLRGLRYRLNRGPHDLVKWDDLRPVMQEAPQSEIAIGARRALRESLLTVVDPEGYYEKLGEWSRRDALARTLADDLVIDWMLEDQPTIQAATPLRDPWLDAYLGTDGDYVLDHRDLLVQRARERLGIPPRINRESPIEAAIAAILQDRRPGQYFSLHFYAARDPATLTDWLDPLAWGEAVQHSTADSRYFDPNRIRVELLSRSASNLHSVETGNDPSVRLINDGREALRYEQQHYLLRPIEFAPVLQHRILDADEAQAADMAAGYGLWYYQRAYAEEGCSRQTAAQRLCNSFRSVIFNGRLLQRG
jgi:hypothetical protein